MIDVPNLLGTVAVEIIGNIGLNTGHSLTGNTINIVETGLSYLSFNLTNIKYDKTYFKDTNIFNMVCGINNTTTQLAYGSSFTNISKSLNIASSSTISEFTNIGNIINISLNCSFNIVGDKLVAAPGTNGNDVEPNGSNCTITFKDITFSSSNTQTGSLINYIATNNDLETAGNNIKLSFINTKFYTTSSINSLTTGFVTADNYVNTSTYKVYLIDAGTFLLGNDPLVLLSDTVYFNNGNSSNATASNATLCNTDSSTKYPRRLTIIAETVNNLLNINLIVKAMGLDVIDNYTGEHYINLNGLSIDVTTEDIINITPNNTYSKININNSSNSGVVIYGTAMVNNNIITIKDSSQSTTPNANRVLTINALTGINFWVGNQIKHFIVNQNTMLLNINAALDQTIVTHNMIYWPKLSTMEQTLPPLSGGAVKYAEAWEFVYGYTTYPTILQNNYTDVALNAGLFIDNVTNTAENIVTQADWTNKNLRYLQVYSADALSGLSFFNIVLIKSYTNTTNHTGKIDNTNQVGTLSFGGDQKVLSDLTALGWLDCLINFTVDKLALMPITNNITLTLEPCSVSAEVIINSTWLNNAYKINQNQTITKSSTTYSVKEYFEATITNDVLRTIYFDGSYHLRTDAIKLTEEEIIINDPNDPTAPYDTITTTTSQTIYYNITPVSGSAIYLLVPLYITLSTAANYVIINEQNSSNTVGAFTYTSISYPNIDNIDPLVRSGSSNAAAISLAKDPIAWTTKTINVSIDIGTYQASQTVAFDFDIENQGNDNQLSGIPLTSYDSAISTPINVDVTNTVTFTDKVFTKNVSNNVTTHTLTTYIALYSRIISSGGYELRKGTLLIVNDTTETPRGTATFTKWVYYDGAWMTWTDANTLAGSALYTNKVDITDTIIRYQMDIVIDDITLLNVAVPYTVKFTLSDENTIQIITTPLNINIQSINIPLAVELSTNSQSISTSADIYTTYNQTTNTYDFSLFVNFSAGVRGNVSLAFTNKPNAEVGYDDNQYDMTYFMDNIKLVDSTNLSSTSTLTPFGALDITTLDPTDRITATQVELKYRFSPLVIPGTFYINVALDKLRNLADNADINLGDNTPNTLTLHYLETVKHQINITIDKVLNTGNPPREVLGDVNVTNRTNNTITIEDTASTSNVLLVPPEFNYQTAISSEYLTPYNKYTQYFLSVNTTSLGFSFTNDDPSTITSSPITINFIFRDETNNSVDDIEVINSNGILIDNLLSQNFTPSVSGNTVLVFRRKLNIIGNTERTYSSLKVLYYFSNLTNNNYKNLSTAPVLLTIIDYSNYGMSSQKFSELCIGNWRIVPSGDGAKLLFERVVLKNPYSVTIPMTPTAITAQDLADNDSTLLSLEEL